MSKKHLCMIIAITLNAIVTVTPLSEPAWLWEVGARLIFTLFVYFMLGVIFFKEEIKEGRLF